jgi:hypothetical protein
MRLVWTPEALGLIAVEFCALVRCACGAVWRPRVNARVPFRATTPGGFSIFGFQKAGKVCERRLEYLQHCLLRKQLGGVEVSSDVDERRDADFFRRRRIQYIDADLLLVLSRSPPHVIHQQFD